MELEEECLRMEKECQRIKRREITRAAINAMYKVADLRAKLKLAQSELKGREDQLARARCRLASISKKEVNTFDRLEMAPTFYVGSEAGLKKLDENLLSPSYITGYQASKDDLTFHAAFTNEPSSQYMNVSRLFNHIGALLRISDVYEGSGVIVEGSASFPEEAIATPPTNGTKAAVDDDDSDVDEAQRKIVADLRTQMEVAEREMKKTKAELDAMLIGMMPKYCGEGHRAPLQSGTPSVSEEGNGAPSKVHIEPGVCIVMAKTRSTNSDQQYDVSAWSDLSDEESVYGICSTHVDIYLYQD